MRSFMQRLGRQLQHRPQLGEAHQEPRPPTAEKRALALLKRTVTPAEWREFEAHQHITIHKPGQTFLIFFNQRTMVKENGRRYHCCIQFTERGYPPADRVVAEYLLIRHATKRYLQIANTMPPASYRNFT